MLCVRLHCPSGAVAGAELIGRQEPGSSSKLPTQVQDLKNLGRHRQLSQATGRELEWKCGGQSMNTWPCRGLSACKGRT